MADGPVPAGEPRDAGRGVSPDDAPGPVVVVVPTYNEAENIQGIIRGILELRSRPDVVVVDDSSPDGTADVVRALAHDEPRVQLQVRSAKEGLGRAYGDAFASILGTGRYGVVTQMDADGSHDPADVDRLVDALRSADLAIGSRYVPGGAVEGWDRRRLLLSRLGNAYARALLRVGVRDLTGGFKAWRASLLADLDYAAALNDGYGFQIEMTARAVAAGARVVEVPITFRERVAGSSKMSRRIAVEALRTVPRLRSEIHR